MEGEVSVGTPKDTLSLTPATRDTDSQEVLQEHVSLMDCGQEAQLLAQVSVRFIIIIIKHVVHGNSSRTCQLNMDIGLEVFQHVHLSS